jgi:hypothetical protein
LAFVVGVSAMGILFSSLAATRQAAAALTVLFIILAWTIYPIMCSSFTASYSYTWSRAVGPQWNIAYLWPGLSFEHLSGGFVQGKNGPNLCLAAELTGVGCAIAWSLLAILALWIADGKHRRGGGVQDE